MKTTDVVIELFVTGVGGLIWIVLLIAWKIENSEVFLKSLFSIDLLPVVIGSIFIIGVIIDRLADDFFHYLIDKKLRGNYFENLRDYHKFKAKIRYKSDGLNNFLEYQKMKIRVIRGTSFNLILILIFSFLYIGSSVYNHYLSFIIFFGFMALLASIYSFIRINQAHYKRVIDFYNILEK